mmetsp:Transcript_61967/g.145299  ORF Transcript_61967/g.145299 Transcript_61967/m.145299 type:complete len:250 (+) Transcript_61967:378-1127(+)
MTLARPALLGAAVQRCHGPRVPSRFLGLVCHAKLVSHFALQTPSLLQGLKRLFRCICSAAATWLSSLQSRVLAVLRHFQELLGAFGKARSLLRRPLLSNPEALLIQLQRLIHFATLQSQKAAVLLFTTKCAFRTPKHFAGLVLPFVLVASLLWIRPNTGFLAPCLGFVENLALLLPKLVFILVQLFRSSCNRIQLFLLLFWVVQILWKQCKRRVKLTVLAERLFILFKPSLLRIQYRHKARHGTETTQN